MFIICDDDIILNKMSKLLFIVLVTPSEFSYLDRELS
jgi:hypothetical protein